ALAGHVRNRTSINHYRASCPNHADGLIIVRKPPASADLLQAVFSAFIAPPPGLVRKLKMEGDNQFFRSLSVRPHWHLMALTISRASSSGPFSAINSGVASTPSTVNPVMPTSPQRKYSWSISHARM